MSEVNVPTRSTGDLPSEAREFGAAAYAFASTFEAGDGRVRRDADPRSALTALVLPW